MKTPQREDGRVPLNTRPRGRYLFNAFRRKGRRLHVVAVSVLLSFCLTGCAAKPPESATVPSGKAAMLIANRLCKTYGMRTGPWHIQFEDGIWTLWRFDGRQTIHIEASSGDTVGCMDR
jgi:hypothetical protein